MMRVPQDFERARFSSLCARHSFFEVRGGEFAGIGIYNEKRIHRIIKEFVSSDESSFEVKLGGSVADVFSGGIITEVQTGGFYPLKKKIAAYIENTNHQIKIIHPAIVKKTIVRVDPLTGEILRKKVSPKKESALKILPELLYLSEHFGSDRLSFEVYGIEAEEHRYSDEIHRRRKAGKYDSELFPIALESITEIATRADVRALLPSELLSLPSFSAADFTRLTGFRGRRAYLALTLLTNLEIIKKEKQGTKVTYIF